MMTNHLNTRGFRNADIEAAISGCSTSISSRSIFRARCCIGSPDYVYPFPQREMCVWSRAQIVEALASRAA